MTMADPTPPFGCAPPTWETTPTRPNVRPLPVADPHEVDDIDVEPPQVVHPPMRVPPHNLQAEASLLGAMLLSRKACAAASIVEPDDFYKPAHGDIFDAITTTADLDLGGDLHLEVADRLYRRGQMEAIGGRPTLVTLMADCPAIGSAARYARIVVDHAVLRRLIGVAGELAEVAFGLPTDLGPALDHALDSVADVRARWIEVAG